MPAALPLLGVPAALPLFGVPAALPLFGVPAELLPHGGEDLVGEGGLAVGAEALVDGRGQHRRGGAGLDTRLQGPAALTGIGDLAAERRQGGVLGEGVGGQIE